MKRKHYPTVDLKDAIGEERRVSAALKSFSSRNPANVCRTITKVIIGEGDDTSELVEVSWHSHSGEYSQRSWRVACLFDEGMMTPGNRVRVDVTGSDGEFHHYSITRQTFDRLLSRRLGYEYSVYTLEPYYQSYWKYLGGQYYSRGEMPPYKWVPTHVQWSLGQLGFAELKNEVQRHIYVGDPEDIYGDLQSWLDMP